MLAAADLKILPTLELLSCQTFEINAKHICTVLNSPELRYVGQWMYPAVLRHCRCHNLDSAPSRWSFGCPETLHAFCRTPARLVLTVDVSGVVGDGCLCYSIDRSNLVLAAPSLRVEGQPYFLSCFRSRSAGCEVLHCAVLAKSALPGAVIADSAVCAPGPG